MLPAGSVKVWDAVFFYSCEALLRSALMSVQEWTYHQSTWLTSRVFPGVLFPWPNSDRCCMVTCVPRWTLLHRICQHWSVNRCDSTWHFCTIQVRLSSARLHQIYSYRPHSRKDNTCGSVRACVCVSIYSSVGTLLFEPFDFWPWFLAWRSTLTLVSLGLYVKGQGQTVCVCLRSPVWTCGAEQVDIRTRLAEFNQW